MDRSSDPVPLTGVRVRKLDVIFVLGLVISSLSAAYADQGLLPYTVAIPRTEETDSLRLATFELLRYDSNFYRLADGVDPPNGKPRSMFTSTSGLGLSFYKSYGQQLFFLDTSVMRDEYSRASNLAFTSYQIKAAYFWHLTPELSGTVVFNRSRLPTDYEYIGFQTRPNARTAQVARASVDLRAGAGLHPRFTVFESEASSVNPTFQLQNSRGAGGEISAVYRFASNNNLEAYANKVRGRQLDSALDLVNSTTNQFSQVQTGVRGHWALGDGFTADGDVSHVKRTYDLLAIRDYSGTTWNLNLLYAVTGKTQFSMSASRNLYGAQTNISNFFYDDDLSVGVQYAATGKITFKPSYVVRRQRYAGSPFPVDQPFREISHYAMFEVDYAALRALDLSFAVTRSSRGATEPTLNFGDRSAAVFARLKF